MDGFLAQGRTTPDRAFERLYRRHVADVYRFASAMLSSSADAEDVVQTTFLNAYRAFERGQRPNHPRSWLIAIANNVCRQRFRQQSRRPNEVELDDDLAAAPVEEEERVGAEDIRRALSELAFNQRAALVMRELEGRSYAEIAETLGLSHAAVETLIFRARRALREQLEGGLTCSEAEHAISLQLDGMLPLRDRAALRAHLRACPDCRSLAKRARGQRSALRGLGTLPLPATLASFATGGGGATAVGAGAGAGGLVLKIAAVTAAVGVAGGGVAGYEEAHHATVRHHHRVAAPAAAHARARPRPVPAVSTAPVIHATRPEHTSHTAHPAATTPALVVDSPVTTSAPHGKSAIAAVSHAGNGKGAAKGRQHAPPGKVTKADTKPAPTSTQATHCKNGQGTSSSSHSHGHGKAQGHSSSTACTQVPTDQPPTDTTTSQSDSGPPPHSGGGGHGSPH